jgi:FlaA1/EpsC-like NDP-sugar epimerase
MYRVNVYVANILKSYLIWAISIFFAMYLRFEFTIPNEFVNEIPLVSAFITVAYLITKIIDQQIFGKPSSLTFEEFSSIIRQYCFVGLFVSTFLFIYPEYLFPKSIPLLSSIFALGLTQIANKTIKFYFDSQRNNSNSIPVAIYGGGQKGKFLLKKISNEPELNWNPIVIFDKQMDSKIKKIDGVKVITHLSLHELLQLYKPKKLIVASTSLNKNELQEIQIVCDRFNLELLYFPSIKVLGEEFTLKDLKKPSVTSLLGKSLLKNPHNDSHDFFYGKTILITGAGGSIGSELARQIHSQSPQNLFLLDRDESALLDLNVSLKPDGSLNQSDLILADLRDHIIVKEILNRIKPEIIFHTAALKHLTLLENFPEEALKSNIMATDNLLKASIENKVRTFVNISSDKAADPTSVLGFSKLFTEKMTAAAALASPTSCFMSVRFGNVFGSRGSVLNIFNQQIEKGGPITITAKGITRYFMTIEDAIYLVLKAASLNQSGVTQILNMGEPILIEDIAQRMILSSGKSIKIEFGQLRSGEKLHESLIGQQEVIQEQISDDLITIKVEGENIDSSILTWNQFKQRYFPTKT